MLARATNSQTIAPYSFNISLSVSLSPSLPLHIHKHTHPIQVHLEWYAGCCLKPIAKRMWDQILQKQKLTLFLASLCSSLCLFHLKARSDKMRSVAQSCLTLCDPMNCSTPGLPVHHQLPEFTETHVHRVSDVIQPSHPLSSPSHPAPNPSQHQSLLQ